MLNPLSQMRFPAQYAEVLESLVIRRNVDPARLYAEGGLSRADLESPGATLDGAQLQRMLRFCQTVADPERPLSAQLLEHFPVTAHGALGLLVLTSPNLERALDAALKYYPVVVPACEITRQDWGSQINLVFKATHDFGDMAATLMEITLGAFNSIREYITSDIPRLEIHLSHENRFPLERYDTFADPERLHFNQPCNKLVIPRHYLSAPLTTSNRLTMQQFEQQLERQIRELGETKVFTSRVRQRVMQALRAGRSLTIDEIAASLNLSERTLSRRLHEEGSVYKDLVNELRVDYAEFLLMHSRKTIGQIALATGFANDSSLSRAFRRRKGITPTELRQRMTSRNADAGMAPKA